MMNSVFDLVVIGKGLVGSAAAKYLAASENKVALIGPEEPDDYRHAKVFASHYDEARVQRIIGKDEVWTKLNYDSIKQYESIQSDSGINFHVGAGCLYINPYAVDHYLKSYKASADKLGLQYELIDGVANPKTYKGFEFPGTAAGIFEHLPSGYINPRQLLKAQLKIFEKRGGLNFTDTVNNVFTNNDHDFIIETEGQKKYTAKKVLVATGSFMNHLNILPKKIDLINKSEVVLLIRVEEDNLAEYSNLPSLLYELDEHDTEGIYLIPPVKYPDGYYYLKVGCNSPMDIYFENLNQIQEWFRNTDAEKFKAPLVGAVKKLLPSLPLETLQVKKCLISRTFSGRPYIGETSRSGLFLAGGCNGYSAMCSDAIGQVASKLILNGALPKHYPKDAFSIFYKK